MQITRVSPIEISAEPVAVRTNPGLDRHRPERVRSTAVAALADAGELMRASGPEPEVHVDHLAERHLQEARPQRVERVDVAGAQESVAALAASAG